MNPIVSLEREIEALLKANELVRAYLNGWGTSSYDVLHNPEAQAVAKHVKGLRRQIAGLRKRAGLRHKTSSVAHR